MSSFSDCRPVFIIGAPRSGTSVLTWCIGQHSNILPLPETHWIADAALGMEDLYAAGSSQGKYTHLGALDWSANDFYAAYGEAIDRLVIQTRPARRNFILKEIATRSGKSVSELEEILDKGGAGSINFAIERSKNDPKKRWVDGTPRNTFYTFCLAQMFPNAKFIHLLRAPHDVVLSLSNFSQAGSGGTDFDLARANQTWKQHVTQSVLTEDALGPDRVIRIEFSDLIRNSEETLAQLCAFLGEEFELECLLPLKEKINSSKVKAGEGNRKPLASDENQALFVRLTGSSELQKEVVGENEAMQRLQSQHRALRSNSVGLSVSQKLYNKLSGRLLNWISKITS